MTKRLYIGNLATTTTKQTLSEAFQRDGRQVTAVDLVMSRDVGHSRGFAFVEMATESEGEAAMQALNGAVLDGNALKVQVAAERKSRFGGVSGFGDRRPSR
jgi:RNA recognition motif-containing protein